MHAQLFVAGVLCYVQYIDLFWLRAVDQTHFCLVCMHGHIFKNMIPIFISTWGKLETLYIYFLSI